MTRTIQAVYESGVLRPTTPVLDAREGQKFLVVLEELPEVEPDEADRRRTELLRRMEAAGALAHFPTPTERTASDWRPLTVEGEPLSETIIKMRGEK